LGKGLGALIPEHQQYFDSSKNPADVGDSITIVPLARLKPNPDQPRKTFPDSSIDELAESIRKHGLLQPILAEPASGGDYIIVAGERRFRAAGRAGLTEVPVIVRSVSSEKRLQLSLIENIQRENLNPIEVSLSFKRLIDECNLTQDQVAEKVGKERSTVTNFLRLLKLPEKIRQGVRENKISMGHARALLSVADEKKQLKLFTKIVEDGWSVRKSRMRGSRAASCISSWPVSSVEPLSTIRTSSERRWAKGKRLSRLRRTSGRLLWASITREKRNMPIICGEPHGYSTPPQDRASIAGTMVSTRKARPG